MSGDEAAIYTLTQRAFKTMPFSNGSEGPIVNQLRKDGDLTLSLVAVQDSEIIGHVAFSPIRINHKSAGWFGLGPVSVMPDLQRQGVGSRLITEGLFKIKLEGAVGCALIGNPNYYKRFGFRSNGNLKYGETPAPFVQWLSFGEETAKGVLSFAPAFDRDYAT